MLVWCYILGANYPFFVYVTDQESDNLW